MSFGDAVAVTRNGKSFFAGTALPPRLVGQNNEENHPYTVVSPWYNLARTFYQQANLAAVSVPINPEPGTRNLEPFPHVKDISLTQRTDLVPEAVVVQYIEPTTENGFTSYETTLERFSMECGTPTFTLISYRGRGRGRFAVQPRTVNPEP